MYRILRILIIFMILSSPSLAGSDGKDELSKNSNGQVKDCFETINEGLHLMSLRKVVFEPLAKGYLYLPSPVRTGASNALSNVLM